MIDKKPYTPNIEISNFNQRVEENLIGQNLSFSYLLFSDAENKQFIEDHFGSEILTISDTEITFKKDKFVRIKGTLSAPFLGANNLLVVLTYYNNAKGLGVVAKLKRFPRNWMFSQAFSGLAESLQDTFKFQNVTFNLDSSQENIFVEETFRSNLGYLPLNSDVNLIPQKLENKRFFKHGWSFTGTFRINQLPRNYKLLLQDEEHTTITVEGPINIVNEQVEFYFTSPPGKTFTVFGKEFPLHFGLGSIRKEKLTEDLFSEYFFDDFVQVYCPSAFEINNQEVMIEGKALFLESPLLNLKASFDQGLEVAASDLISLVEANNLFNKLKRLTGDVSLTLKVIGVDLDFRKKMVRGANIAFSLNAEVELHEQFKLSGLDLYLSTGFTNRSHLLYAESQLTVFQRAFKTSFSLPNKRYQVTLIDEQGIELNALLDQLSIPRLSVLEDVICDSLQFSGEIGEGDFAFAIGIESEVEFAFQDFSTELKTTRISASKIDGNWRFRLSGDIVIGGYAFSYYLLKIGDSWQISVKSLSPESILLTSIISDIAEKFQLTLPASVPNVSIQYVSFNYDTSTKEFEFDANTTTALEIPFTDSTQAFDSIIHLETNDEHKLQGEFLSTAVIADNTIQLKFSLNDLNRTVAFSWSKRGDNSLSLTSVLNFIGIDDIVPLPGNIDLDFSALSFEYNTVSKRITLSALTNVAEFFYTWERGVGTQPANQVLGMNLSYEKLSEIPGFSSLAFADSITFDQLSLLTVDGTLLQYTFPVLPPVLTQLGDEGLDQGDNYAPIRPSFGENTMDLNSGISFVIGLQASAITSPSIKPLLDILPFERLVLQVVRTATELSYFTAFEGDFDINLASVFNIAVRQLKLSLQVSSIPTQKPLLGLEADGTISLFGQDLTGKLRLDGNPEETRGAIISQPDQKIGLPAPFEHIKLIGPAVSLAANQVEKSVSIGASGKVQIRTAANEYDFALVTETIGGVSRPQYLSFYIPEFELEDIWALYLNGVPVPTVLSSIISQIDIEGRDISAYWCDTPVQLPNGTHALPGFQMGGVFSVYGFDMYGQLAFRDNRLGVCHFQLDPIDLLFMSVTGNGETQYEINQNNELQKVVDAGGPVFIFNATSFPILQASINVELFGMSFLAINAEINSSGLTFEALTSFLNSEMILSANLALSKDIEASIEGEVIIDLSDLAIQLDTPLISFLVMLDLADVTVRLNIDGTMNNLVAKASINAQILGQELNFDINFDATIDLADIESLIREQILDAVESFFTSIAQNVETFMQTMFSPSRLLPSCPIKLFVFDIKSFGLAQVWSMITQKSAPSVINALSSAAPSLEVYGEIAPGDIRTPQNRLVKSGISCLAKGEFFTLSTGFHFNYSNGFLTAKLQFPAISLGPIFSITGDGLEVDQSSKIDGSSKAISNSGGPIIEVDRQRSTLKMLVKLLEIEADLEIPFANAVFFNIEKSIAGIHFFFQVNYTFSSGRFNSLAVFNVQIEDIRIARLSPIGAVLGHLSINPVVSVNLFIDNDSAKFTCAFSVLDQSISHEFNLQLTSLTNIKEILTTEIANLSISLFEDILTDPIKLVKLIGTGAGTLIMNGVSLSVNTIMSSPEILKDIAQLDFKGALETIDGLIPGPVDLGDLADIGKTLYNDGPEAVLDALNSVKDISPEDAVVLLKDVFGSTAEEAAQVLKNVYGASAAVVGELLRNIYKVSLGAMGPLLSDTFNLGVDAFADAYKSIFPDFGYDALAVTGQVYDLTKDKMASLAVGVYGVSAALAAPLLKGIYNISFGSMAHFLQDAFNLGSTEFAQVYNKLFPHLKFDMLAVTGRLYSLGANELSRLAKHVYKVSAEIAGKVMESLGFAASEIANALHDAGGYSKAAINAIGGAIGDVFSGSWLPF